MTNEREMNKDLKDNKNAKLDRRVARNVIQRFSDPTAPHHGWDRSNPTLFLCRASHFDDLRGTDYILKTADGREIRIDVKNRTKFRSDDAVHFFDYDPPVALETISQWYGDDDPRNKIGWALDESKNTDYYLFLYDSADTYQSILVPAKELHEVVKRNFNNWITMCDRNGRSIYEIQRSFDKKTGIHWKSRTITISLSDLVEYFFDYEVCFNSCHHATEDLRKKVAGLDVLDSTNYLLFHDANSETVERMHKFHESTGNLKCLNMIETCTHRNIIPPVFITNQ